jgi:hypothetical protein
LGFCAREREIRPEKLVRMEHNFVTKKLALIVIIPGKFVAKESSSVLQHLKITFTLTQ